MDEQLPDLQTENVNNSFINTLWIVAEPSEIIMKVSLLLPVVLWGICANCSLIYIIAKYRHLHTATNYLIANMAVTDMLSLLTHPWVYLINDFFQNYQLGEFICLTEGAFEISLLLANVMSLSAISYDRVTAIALPNDTRLTKRRARIAIALFWLFSFAIASPIVIFRQYKERSWINFIEKYCKESYEVLSIYWHVIITLLVWFPLAIMIVCYLIIFIKLYKYERKMKLHNRIIRRARYKTKIAKISFIVILTFLACRLPFTALIFYRNNMRIKSQSVGVINQTVGEFETLWFISKYLIFVNAAVNPIIYGTLNEKFRRAYAMTSCLKYFFIDEDKLEMDKRYANNDDERILKKQRTKETLTESNKNKIFTMLLRAPFHNNNNKGKEVTICERNNEIIHI